MDASPKCKYIIINLLEENKGKISVISLNL